MAIEPPIQNTDSIDIVGRRNDGGVDLVIVAGGPLAGSSTTLACLERKIRNYVAEIGSEGFRTEFGPAPKAHARICIVCEYEVDRQAMQLIERLRPIARRAGIELELRSSML
jgi:hypothetical protein